MKFKLFKKSMNNKFLILKYINFIKGINLTVNIKRIGISKFIKPNKKWKINGIRINRK